MLLFAGVLSSQAPPPSCIQFHWSVARASLLPHIFSISIGRYGADTSKKELRHLRRRRKILTLYCVGFWHLIWTWRGSISPAYSGPRDIYYYSFKDGLDFYSFSCEMVSICKFLQNARALTRLFRCGQSLGHGAWADPGGNGPELGHKWSVSPRRNIFLKSRSHLAAVIIWRLFKT